jgi:single-strand DNA-binding protein
VAPINLNRVTMIGNLTQTRRPSLFQAARSCASYGLRATRDAKQRPGEWESKPNFFTVVAFGATAENCGRYLHSGRPVGIDGRLEQREWDNPEGGKREAVEIIADSIQFLRSAEHSEEDGAALINESAPVPVGVGSDDDIPF